MSREMTVGDVAARSGVSISALHFYERKGLLRSFRTRGNQRRYDRDVLRRVALIQVAQELGIPLAAIGVALSEIPASRPPSREDWERVSRTWAADLDRRLTSMRKLRDSLTACIGCGCLSLERCALFNSDDHLAAEGPGPVLLQRSVPSRSVRNS